MLLSALHCENINPAVLYKKYGGEKREAEIKVIVLEQGHEHILGMWK